MNHLSVFGITSNNCTATSITCLRAIDSIHSTYIIQQHDPETSVMGFISDVNMQEVSLHNQKLRPVKLTLNSIDRSVVHSVHSHLMKLSTITYI